MRLLDLYQNNGSPNDGSREAPLPVSPDIIGEKEPTEQSIVHVARIGELLLAQGVLDQKDIDKILECQRERGVRFGEAAIKLRRLKQRDIDHALARQYACPHPQPDEFAPELIAAYRPAERVVESLRSIRSLLLQRWFSNEPRAMTIVSANNGDGRSFTIANLAVLFAQLGRETLLIDADLRRSRQHEIFRVDNKCGLSSVLSGRMRSERVHRISSLSNLAVLPAGPLPPNPLELLSRDRFATLLQELAGRFQVILVDTPSGAKHADAQIVTGFCRGALLLTRTQRTLLSEAQVVVGRLKQAKAQVLGAVLNKI